MQDYEAGSVGLPNALALEARLAQVLADGQLCQLCAVGAALVRHRRPPASGCQAGVTVVAVTIIDVLIKRRMKPPQ